MHGLSIVQGEQERIHQDMRREARAYAVLEAVMGCDPDDRLMVLEALVEGLRAKMPGVPFDGHVMSEANFWAESASRAERKAYCAACYARLSPEDQTAFRSFIEERTAA